MNEVDKSRITAIYNMLQQIADGNYTAQIDRSEKDDVIEAIGILLNLIAEETFAAKTFLRHLQAPQGPPLLAQLVLVLDKDFRIISANSCLPTILGYRLEECLATSFSSLLTETSAEDWKVIAQDIILNKGTFYLRSLSYTTKAHLVVSALASISLFPEPAHLPLWIVVTTNHPLADDGPGDAPDEGSSGVKAPDILRNTTDLRSIQEIHQYILSTLDEPLMPLRKLAHTFGINEFKLKYGFKQLYNTTVFRFQTRERLNKAHLLIANTSISLKSASKIAGFKSFPHFSKAFKNQYGYSPYVLKKKRDEE